MPTTNQQNLLSQWAAQLETKGGLKLNVRPAAPDDENEVTQLLGQATHEDLRFRFLSAVGKPGQALIRPLIDVDHELTENLLAFDDRDGRLAATAMIAADDDGLDDAEVAVMVRSDLKGRGVGWSMLSHACDYARQRGFKRIHSVQLGDDRSAIELEKEMGFASSRCPGDATLTLLSKDLSES